MPADTTLKRCSRCGETKPRSEFHRQGRAPDGLQRACKACRAEQHRNRVAARTAADGNGTTSGDDDAPRQHSSLTDADLRRLKREGWRVTPEELRPVIAWHKEGVGYVWSMSTPTDRSSRWARTEGSSAWYGVRDLAERRLGRRLPKSHPTIWDAIAALEARV